MLLVRLTYLKQLYAQGECECCAQVQIKTSCVLPKSRTDNMHDITHLAIIRKMEQICDMIKGNESLVENLNSYFLATLSHNSNMLHFDPNPKTIGYLVTEL